MSHDAHSARVRAWSAGVKRRAKSIALTSERFSTALLVTAVALVTLFAWSLAQAAGTSKKLHLAQVQKLSADDFRPNQPSSGATEQERALFVAPRSMVHYRSVDPLPDELYRDQGRLSRAER
jgi:hypothetical protein